MPKTKNKESKGHVFYHYANGIVHTRPYYNEKQKEKYEEQIRGDQDGFLLVCTNCWNRETLKIIDGKVVCTNCECVVTEEKRLNY